MVVVQPKRSSDVKLARIDLDCSAFPGGRLYNLPNIIDPDDSPGELMIVALSDGFDSEIAHVAAMINTIIQFPMFKDFGRFLRTLSFTDQMICTTAWLNASKDAVSVDPKGSSSSSSSESTTPPS